MIRDFQWSDRSALRAVCEAAGRPVLPDNPGGLAFWERLGYLRQPDVLCSKPV